MEKNDKRKPNFFVVGEPKSGTTSLHYYLSQHPDIFMSTPKETRHFSTDFRKEIVDYHKWKGDYDKYRFKNYHSYYEESKYLNLFEKGKENLLKGECSPDYLYSKDAAKNIKQFNSEAKIIMIFREPVEMLYSIHSQFLVSGFEDEVDFSKALELQDKRKKWEKIPELTAIPSYLQYSDFICYKPQIERYLNLFPKDQIMILFFEEFFSNTEVNFKKVLNFLGVDSSIQIDFKIKNPNENIKSLFLNKLSISLPGINLSAKKILPMKIRHYITKKLYNLSVTEEKRAKLDDNLKKRLKNEYTKKVNEFNNYLIEKKINTVNLMKLWKY